MDSEGTSKILCIKNNDFRVFLLDSVLTFFFSSVICRPKEKTIPITNSVCNVLFIFSSVENNASFTNIITCFDNFDVFSICYPLDKIIRMLSSICNVIFRFYTKRIMSS